MTLIEKLSTVTPADWIPGPGQGEWTYNDYAAIVEDGQFDVVNGVLYMSPSPSFTGSTTYPSAAYAVRANGQASFQSVQVAAAGVTADNGYTGTAKRGGLSRWGDYSAGELDPQTGNIWLATQYIPGPGNFAANWGNRIFEVKA